MIEILATRLDDPIVVEHVEGRVGDVPHSQADSTLLTNLFGELAPVDFTQGLIDTIEWMRSLPTDGSTSQDINVASESSR